MENSLQLQKVRSYDNFVLEKLSKKSEDYRVAVIRTLRRLDEFSLNNYSKTRDDIIWYLKSIQDQDKQHDECVAWIQGYTNYLETTFNVNFKSMQGYVSNVKKYLTYYRIRIELGEELELPEKLTEEKFAIPLEDVKLIIENSKPKYKGYFLSLISSGARPGEIMSLRKRDYELVDKTWKAQIPAKYTKKKMSRTIFFSSEVNPYLEPLLKKLNDDDRVWTDDPNMLDEKLIVGRQNAGVMYRTICNKLGFVERYETSGLFKHNMYCFRSYFFTKALRVTNTDTAHAMIGHTAYIDEYQRRNLKEKLELFLEIEPQIMVFDQTRNEQTIAELKKDKENLEIKTTHEINELKQMVIQMQNKSKEPDEPTKELIEKILKDKGILN